MNKREKLQSKIEQVHKRMVHSSESKLNHNQILKLSMEKNRLIKELAELQHYEKEERVSP